MTDAPAQVQSVINFDASQRRLFADESRIIVVNWHRQKGKDFTAAAKAVDRALRFNETWYIISLTQRQADATFAKGKFIADIFKRLLRIAGEDVISEFGSEQYDKWINQAFHFTAREIRFPGGGRVVSLPGRDPDTLAGLTGNIIFTEFGLFPGGGYEHWGVIFPIITRNGQRMIIISTPRGKNTKFYELNLNTDGFYSTHFCDIYQSVFTEGFQLYDALGNPFPQRTRAEQETAIATFRRIYNDESKWPREYECQFTGDLTALIKWAEIEEAAALSLGLDFRLMRIDGESGFDAGFFTRELARGGTARLEVGWDVARKSHLSVVTVNVAIRNQPKHLGRLVLMRNSPFQLMRRVVTGAMDAGGWRSVGCGDSTGLGMESNELLEQKYPERWEGVNFAGTRKTELASGLATAFSDRTQTIPPLDGAHKFVATDIYAIQKDDTGGKLLIDETANPLLEESHCDVAWSLALARRAGTKSPARNPLPAPLMEKPVGW